jgi:hypothetical protein
MTVGFVACKDGRCAGAWRIRMCRLVYVCIVYAAGRCAGSPCSPCILAVRVQGLTAAGGGLGGGGGEMLGGDSEVDKLPSAAGKGSDVEPMPRREAWSRDRF